MESSRNLLEGDRVEVRQREVGLRGSWHPGVVVKVKNGYRIVEYDEILSRDGKKKLQEMIPLQEKICMRPSISVDHHTIRGFIRPLPPTRYLSSVRSPKRGLLVDAFYEHAWWEGVLLHDLPIKGKDCKVKVLFPDEGDELLCSIKDIRVSQEWDEMSTQWRVHGSWSFRGNNGELDIDCLRSICRNRWSLLKKSWRQKTMGVSIAQENKASKKTAVDRLLSGDANSLPVVEDGKSGICSNSESEQRSCVMTSKWKKVGTVRNSLKEKYDGSNGTLLKTSSPSRVSLRKSQYAAERFLLDAGWKFGFRVRNTGLLQGEKYMVYTAPDGSNYYSVAAACRVWKQLKNLPSTSEEGKSHRTKLLNAYSLAEQFMSSGKRQKTAKSGQHEERDKRQLWKGKSEGLHSSFVGAKMKKPSKISYAKLENMKKKTTDGAKKSSSLIGAKIRKPAKVSHAKLENMMKKTTDCSKKSKKKKSIDERTGIQSKIVSYSEKVKKKRFSEEVSGQKCKKARPWLKHRVPYPETNASLGKGGCRMQVLLSSPGQHNNSKKGHMRTEAMHFKKSTVLSWLIDKGLIKDSETVRYLSRRDGHVMKKGAVTREGILCKCCKAVFTLSNFEAHAGSKLHRPSANIFLDDGRSITDCQLQACALEDVKEDSLADVSDDTCGLCADGGELILCDHCPSTFHPNCIGLEVVPDGEWYCPRCCCNGCGQVVVDGNQENTMHQCYQCELGYHSFCVDHSFYPPKAMLLKPQGKATGPWFCGHECEKIFITLRNLVGKINHLDNGYSWMLLRSMRNDAGLSPHSFETMAEHNVKLGVAHDVMQECFVPMIDPKTKINLISQALYNRKSRVSRLDYGGFFTMVLEKGDEMITVAAIRVHGNRLAEMPLVGTRYQYRRQGMCRRLIRALEQMLESLGVNKLVLPAVPELLDTWTTAFHFQHMTVTETQDLTRFKLMTFPGTTLLQKQLKKELSMMPISDNINKIERDPKMLVDADGNNMILLNSSGCIDSSDPKGEISLCQKASHHEGSSVGFHCIESNEQTLLEGSNSLSNLGNDGTAEKGDGVLCGRVVRASTRSKRLVKSSHCITDGLKEFANKMNMASCSTVAARNSRKVGDEINPSLGTVSHSNQISANHNPVSNVDTLAVLEGCINNLTLAPDDPGGISEAQKGFDFSPVIYTRRNRLKKPEEVNYLTMIDVGE